MEYRQDGLLGDFEPGERVRGLLGNADVGQDGGLLETGPLRRLDPADIGPFGNESDDAAVPDEPGPALAGRTPVVGTARRKNGLPVARDKLSNVGE